MSNKLYSLFLLILVLSGLSSFTQTVPVGMPVFEDYYRRAQLLGKFDEAISFTSRPFFPAAIYGTNIFDPDSMMFLDRVSDFDGLWEFGKGKGLLQLLPISILTQYNSHHPEGINDGAMIPARGFQTLISGGLFLKLGHLSIQLRPEFVHAQNLGFDGFQQYSRTRKGRTFPNSPYRNRIDLPERFGETAYNQIFWGQSSVRLRIGSVSIGLSNENLWWGSGYRNSLLMTNSAAGFKHLTLNTVRPIKTWIGSFEGQMIAGRLEESGFIENLADDWRYMNGMVVSYQPKWIPGLFLGAARSFLIYSKDMGSGLNYYLPVFSFLTKKSGGGANGEVNSMRQDQLISVFMRWLIIKEDMEIYFEYGREDHSWDVRDFILEPEHSSAYLLGLRKLLSLNKLKGTSVQLILETTNLESPATTIARNKGEAKGSWYQHGQVKHGYTNLGQLIGAGIGPGGSLQTFDISWVKSLKQIGVQVERYRHNNDFWFDYVKDYRSHWVDLSAMAYAHWDYKKLLFTAKLKFISSYNYQWLYDPDNKDYWAHSKNTFNFHGQLGIVYRF